MIILKSRKIIGIVIQNKRCGTGARPVASEVSLPELAGITIVFRPRGIAMGDIQLPSAETAEVAKVGTGISQRPITIPISISKHE